MLFRPCLILLLSICALSACSEVRSEARRKASAAVDARNAVLVVAWVPKSLVFRNETVRLGPDGATVCGEFNGLNRKRQWAGYRRYIHEDGEIALEDREAAFEARWRRTCGALEKA